LFEDTINRDVEGIPTTQYLWDKKKVVPFLKSDVGLAPPADGVQMMKDHPGLIQKVLRNWSHSSSNTASGPSPRE